jgi:hypothetical protein
MTHTWYVTFEVPKGARLVRRRSPRSTSTFATEAEAKEFARAKFEQGLVVTAGTIIPHLPRHAIPSSRIAAWLEPVEEEPTENPPTDREPGSGNKKVPAFD